MEKTNENMLLILEEKLDQLDAKLSNLLNLEEKIGQLDAKLSKMVKKTTVDVELILEEKIGQLDAKLSTMVNKTTDDVEDAPFKIHEKPLTNSDIIGTPIKMGRIEVAEHGFPDIMNWHDASSACKNLGFEWRLPFENELEYLYHYKHRVGGFNNGIYWTCQEDTSGTRATKFSFDNCSTGDFVAKEYLYYVRAVRWNRE